MKWSTPIESWVRREALLTSLVAALTAVSALSAILGWTPVWLSVAAIPAGGAVLRFLVRFRQSQVEGRREKEELDRRLRTAVAPIDAVSPTKIGVEAAAQDLLPGGEIPDYLPRVVDEDIQNALTHAFAGQEPWIVAVSGPSKVGKSRTLFEALHACAAKVPELFLVAPVDGDAVRSLLQSDRTLKVTKGRFVVWLDDIEVFAADGVGFETLREWHERSGAVFAVTYGGKGSERTANADAPELAFLTQDILSHTQEIHLDVTSSSELERLPETVSAINREMIEGYGLAAAMVAAPALQRKLNTRRHAAGDPESFEGEAIVYAAVDWARCGRTDSIPLDRLRRIWPRYLRRGITARDDGFDSGLEWALRPVAGRIALLSDVGGLRPYDYVVRYVTDQADSKAPIEDAWALALNRAEPHQAFSVGLRAFLHDRPRHAIAGMSIARGSANEVIARFASYNLGVMLWEQGDAVGAEAAYRQAADLGDGDAHAGLGVLLSENGDTEGAETAYREALALGHGGGASNLGQLLKARGDLQGAEAAFRKASELGYGGGAFNLGNLLKERGDLPGAEAALSRAAELGEGDAACNLGVMLMERGDSDGAEAAYRRATELGSGGGAFNLGQLLNRRDEPEKAEAAYRSATELNHAGGAFALGFLLKERGDLGGAIDAYRRAAELGDGRGSVNLGVMLQAVGDIEGARRAFEEARASDEPEVAMRATGALAVLDASAPDATS